MSKTHTDKWFEGVWWLSDQAYGRMTECNSRAEAQGRACADVMRGYGKPGRDEIHIIHKIQTRTVEVFRP